MIINISYYLFYTNINNLIKSLILNSKKIKHLNILNNFLNDLG